MPNFASFSKCLYCIWPALIIGIGWFLSRGIDHKTYYGALPVGIDPLSTAGQTEFETQRQRDAEKRRLIFWCVGIILAGYLFSFLFNTFTVKVKAAGPTLTPTLEATLTETATQEASPSITVITPTETPTVSPTYAPTATDRVVVWLHTKIIEHTVVITQIVPVEVTRIVTYTYTPTYTPTATNTPTVETLEP